MSSQLDNHCLEFVLLLCNENSVNLQIDCHTNPVKQFGPFCSSVAFFWFWKWCPLRPRWDSCMVCYTDPNQGNNNHAPLYSPAPSHTPLEGTRSVSLLLDVNVATFAICCYFRYRMSRYEGLAIFHRIKYLAVPVKTPTASVDRLSAFQGPAGVCFPCGSHRKACRMMLKHGLLRVWPSQSHFLLLTLLSNIFWLAF